MTCLSLVAGVFFPVALLPNWIEWTSEVQPLTPSLDLLRHLIVGTPIDSAWWAVFRLVAFARRPAPALDPRPRRVSPACAAAGNDPRVLMASRKRPSSADILEARARVPDHVVHRSFAHETVILNLKTGKYHGLNPTAGAMLTELERGATVAEAAAQLAASYDRPVEEIEQDLSDLCLDLLERGLIELTDSDGRPFEAAESGDDG